MYLNEHGLQVGISEDGNTLQGTVYYIILKEEKEKNGNLGEYINKYEKDMCAGEQYITFNKSTIAMHHVHAFLYQRLTLRSS